jgi:hypothetical protein
MSLDLDFYVSFLDFSFSVFFCPPDAREVLGNHFK